MILVEFLDCSIRYCIFGCQPPNLVSDMTERVGQPPEELFSAGELDLSG
jgi:hypothetical protein